MKLWYISEIAWLYCGIAERITRLSSDLACIVIARILLYIICNINSSSDRWRRNLSNRHAVNGGTDTAGVDSVLPMYAIVMPYQIAIANESSATQPTLEVLSGRVGSDVDRKLGLAGEGH